MFIATFSNLGSVIRGLCHVNFGVPVLELWVFSTGTSGELKRVKRYKSADYVGQMPLFGLQIWRELRFMTRSSLGGQIKCYHLKSAACAWVEKWASPAPLPGGLEIMWLSAVWVFCAVKQTVCGIRWAVDLPPFSLGTPVSMTEWRRVGKGEIGSLMVGLHG